MLPCPGSLMTCGRQAECPVIRVTGAQLDEQRSASPTAGGLARFAGTCARHPVAGDRHLVRGLIVLGGLNVAFHGTLVNEFKVPGTDFQKATDLINAKFGAQKGAALAGRDRRTGRPAAGPPPRPAPSSRRCSPQAGRRRAKLDENPKNAARDRRPAGHGLQPALRRTAGSRSSTPSSTGPDSSCRARTSSTLEDQLRRSASRPASRSSSPARPRAPPPRRAPASISGCSPAFFDPAGPVPRAGADRDPAPVRDRRGDRRRSCALPRRPVDATSTRSSRSSCR